MCQGPERQPRGAEVHRDGGGQQAAVHHRRVLGAGVQPVHPPLRLPRDPAHPGALQRRADRARAGGAPHPHRGAHPGPVRQLRGAARPRQGQARGQEQDRYGYTDCFIELQTKVREDFIIMEEAPTRAFYWLKVLSHLRHYAEQVVSRFHIYFNIVS